MPVVERPRLRCDRPRTVRMMLTALVASVVAATMSAQAAAAQGAGSVAEEGGVVAIPAAESMSASPDTAITLRSLPAGLVPHLTVAGSVSGSHTGSLEPHRDARGVTFQPDAPFAPGETVTVQGPPEVIGSDGGTYSFRVATPGVHPGLLLDNEPMGQTPPIEGQLTRAAAAAVPPVATPNPNSPYASRPDLAPPSIDITATPTPTAPGLLFATPVQTATSAAGVVVYDNNGAVVWFHEAPGLVVGNASVQTLAGEPVLTWFEGTAPYGAGNYRGEYKLVDSSYQELSPVRMGNGYQADIHDFLITPQGTALMVAYNPLICDGVAIQGCAPGATVLDGVVQEVDIATDALLFEWHAIDHLPLTDSYVGLSSSLLDFLHPNSLDLDADGNVLLSGRHTSALYKIDRQSGAVIFILGGKRDQFTYVGDPETIKGPDYPHDFRARGSGSYSYFDNGIRRQAADGTATSRAVVVTLDNGTKTATYTKILRHQPGGLFGPTQGRMQALPDGGNLVAWGGLGVADEYSAADAQIFTSSLSAGTYRQERHEWVGRPTAPPDIAVTARSGSAVSIAVSWNGDTRAASWRLLSGSTPGTLAPVGTTARTGFETVVGTAAASRYLAVEALDSGGAVLPHGRSAVIKGAPYFAEVATPPVNGSYLPLVGDFGGSRNDDVLYYSPSGADYLHISDGSGGFTSSGVTVRGTYQPVVGDFVGDDRDEILWRANGQTVAYMWRFDSGARTASPRVQSTDLAVPATVTAAVLLDNRPGFGGGKDELLYYVAGPAADRIDHFVWQIGQRIQVTSRPTQINGAYQPVVGDLDGNGLADVLWYAPGAAPDAIWLMTGNAAGSTGYRDIPVSINGRYSVIAADLVGTDRQFELLFYAPGSAGDYLWTVDATGAVGSTDVSSAAGAAAFALPGPGAPVMLWSSGDGSPSLWHFSGASPVIEPSGNAPVGIGYTPIIGDFVGAGGAPSVLWYAPGPSPERMFVG